MKNYKIAVAGTGYVGLSLGVLLSQHHQVVAVDIVQAKVDMMAASTMYRKSPGALAAGGRCLIGCILSRLSGDKKTMRRSRNRKEAEKVKIP